MAVAFLLVSIAVYNTIAVLIPKKLNKLERWTTSLFAITLVWTVDGILNLKFDMYGYFNKGTDLLGIVALYGIYPAVNIIFLNLYPFHKGKWIKAAYIFGWSLYALLYEWLAVQSAMFYHKGWHYWYSALLNPFFFWLLVWHLKRIRRLADKETTV